MPQSFTMQHASVKVCFNAIVTAVMACLRTSLGAAGNGLHKCAFLQMTETQQAIVKCCPAEDNVRIELVLAGKQRFMSRPKTEPLERTLNRIQIAAAPVPGAVADLHNLISHGNIPFEVLMRSIT